MGNAAGSCRFTPGSAYSESKTGGFKALRSWPRGSKGWGFFCLFVLILGFFMAFPSGLNAASWAWGFVVWQPERVFAARLSGLAGKEPLSGDAELAAAAACQGPRSAKSQPNHAATRTEREEPSSYEDAAFSLARQSQTQQLGAALTVQLKRD